MAGVYLAVRADGEFRQQVAIKLVRAGLDSDEVLSRFRNERQTLAGLDHPNIVKLLDGGSNPEGTPYLVMDYVEGSPIDEYCDRHKLSVEERLHLFGRVCEAVEYAHQKQVIHRDLKPSNILVTADGVPKLLDFGIAKVLSAQRSDEALRLTHTGARCMTPAYASPEQVRGKFTPLARRYRHSRPNLKRISRRLHGLSNLIDAFRPALFMKQGQSRPTSAIEELPSARRVLENISIDRHAWHSVTRNIFAVRCSTSATFQAFTSDPLCAQDFCKLLVKWTFLWELRQQEPCHPR
jgi:serine/threonine protein kinase